MYASDGIHFLADGDPYYHVLRATQIARDWPHVPSRDPRLDWPIGADVPWPPLFDQLIATAAVVAGGGRAGPAEVASVGCVVPVVLGALVIVVAGALAAVVGGEGVTGAALLAALLPAGAAVGLVGRPDQHVAELLLAGLAFLGHALLLRDGAVRRLGIATLALALTLAPWNWLGSALYLLVLGLHGALVHVVAPQGRARAARTLHGLGTAAAVAAAALAASIASLGPTGALRSMTVGGVSGLAPLLTGLLAAVALGLAALSRRWTAASPARRVVEAGLAGAIPLSLAFAFPPSRDGVLHGLTALAASNSWYASIAEFRPALLSGVVPLTSEIRFLFQLFGLGVPLLALAAWVGVSTWRREPDRREALLFLALLVTVFLGLSASRLRFVPYLAMVLSVADGWALSVAGRAFAAGYPERTRPWGGALATAAGLAITLAPAAAMPETLDVGPGVPAGLYQAASWLRTAPATDPGRPGVLGRWMDGHALLYYADRPVVGSPFGTEGGEGALEDEAAFLFARSEADAEAVLSRRRIGVVALGGLPFYVASMRTLAPAGAPPAFEEERSIGDGRTLKLLSGYYDLVPSALYYGDGVARDPTSTPALGGFRLLYESRATSADPLHDERFKLFGVVEGARVQVSGLEANGVVSALVELETNQGRRVAWRTRGVADAAGRASLRVPYATGLNGAVRAGALLLESGSHEGAAAIDERAVLEGGVISVRLP
ncbi:MAG TPA: hypothetical protein VFP50_11440 [Anaeromyxobacteraceae bacterium]|nr:hypothetical protein [Anaeromyxobacteraceae bacterium]